MNKQIVGPPVVDIHAVHFGAQLMTQFLTQLVVFDAKFFYRVRVAGQSRHRIIDVLVQVARPFLAKLFISFHILD